MDRQGRANAGISEFWYAIVVEDLCLENIAILVNRQFKAHGGVQSSAQCPLRIKSLQIQRVDGSRLFVESFAQGQADHSNSS